MEQRRRQNESEQAYIYRICSNKEKIGTWYDVCDLLNAELGRDWTEAAYRKQYQMGQLYLSTVEDELFENEEYIEKIREEKEALLLERKKLQRVNQEYQANLRRIADYQLYKELWLDAIDGEEPIRISPIRPTKVEKVEKTGLLCLSDQHLGKIVELKGLEGEVVNSYSPEIFEARMWKLLHNFEADFAENIMVDKLVIFDLGDCIEGILRCDKTLRSLKTGVIESANHYANFMALWICEAYNRLQIPIEYHLCGGNHDVLRILGEKKKFDDENMAADICSKIHDKVEINKLRAEKESGQMSQIEIYEYTDAIFKSIYDVNILGFHGDSRDLKVDIEFFENYYKVDIDILISGHLHRNSQETIGYGLMGDREIVRVPSIIGADDYSKSIRKLSRAGALYMVFSPDGKEWTKTYYLN